MIKKPKCQLVKVRNGRLMNGKAEMSSRREYFDNLLKFRKEDGAP